MSIAKSSIRVASQDTFLSCYRGTQTGLRHMAYMRMGKVLLVQWALARWNIDLAGKRLFDYGFGAGTFFRYCPRSTRISGVELDPVCVAEVSQMLAQRGYQNVGLEPILLDRWDSHPLLQNEYDVILCSHVMEHLLDPEYFLRRTADCLKPGGSFVALVPINERRQDPHHVRRMTIDTVRRWVAASDFELVEWLEADPWLYWVQPLFGRESQLAHRIGQALSLGLGLLATTLGFRNWRKLSQLFGLLSFSKPTQAAFLLRHRSHPGGPQ